MFQSNVPAYFLLSLFSILAKLLPPHSSITEMYKHIQCPPSIFSEFPEKSLDVQIFLSKSENLAVSLVIEN